MAHELNDIGTALRTALKSGLSGLGSRCYVLSHAPPNPGHPNCRDRPALYRSAIAARASRSAPCIVAQRTRGQMAPKAVPVPRAKVAGRPGAPHPEGCVVDPPRWRMAVSPESWRTIGVLTPTPGEAQLTAAPPSRHRFPPAAAAALAAAERRPLPVLSAPGSPAPHQDSPPCACLVERARGERRPRR